MHDVGDERWAAGRLITTAFQRAGDIECDLFMMQRQNTPGKPIYFVKGYDKDQRVILDPNRGMPVDREGWWKYDVVKRLLDEHPDCLLVWIDDELFRPTRFRRWAEDHDRVRPIGPDGDLGLTHEDLADISAHLTAPTDR